MQKFDKLTGRCGAAGYIEYRHRYDYPQAVFENHQAIRPWQKSVWMKCVMPVTAANCPGFVLNKAPYRQAEILVAGDNFGCGSSREHAPWALLDFGIRCVISTSFADIFYNNCFKNGILPIVVSADERDALLADAADIENPELSIDLVSQTIRRPNGVTISFEVDAFRKKCLLEGLDDIGLTMEKSSAIDSFEAARSQSQPWL